MEMTEYFEFISTPRIIYGPGSIERIGRAAQRINLTKPFLVIDRIFVDSGLSGRIEKLLAAAGMPPAGLLTDIPPDSDTETIRRGYEQALSAGADSVIAVGGGSTLDTAKGLRVMLAMNGVLPEGVNVITKPLPPMLAVPTTAGTGSESTTAAVIRDKTKNIKLTYTDPALIPTIALLDPILTVTMPPAITAGTGMDALAHAVESLHSINCQPLSHGLALHAIRMISHSLPRAVADGADISARGEMLLAATIAGLAFSNSLIGIVHSVAHACGATFRVPHGAACGLMLPYGMEFNMKKSARVYAEVADALKVADRSVPEAEAAAAAVREIRRLALAIGIPRSLADAGVTAEGIPAVVEKALMDGTLMTNPVQPTDEEMLALVEKAWRGDEPCSGAAHASPAKAEEPVTPEKSKYMPAVATPAAPAAAPAVEPKKTEPDAPSRTFTLEDMYRVANGFVRKMFSNPAVTAPLIKSGLIMRFVYFNENWGGEDAIVTVDCSQDPIAFHMGAVDITPVVTMRMHSETARLFWLQKLNLMSAVSKGDITVEGSINEAMRLLPVIKPGFALFKSKVDKPAEKPAENKDGA